MTIRKSLPTRQGVAAEFWRVTEFAASVGDASITYTLSGFVRPDLVAVTPARIDERRLTARGHAFMRLAGRTALDHIAALGIDVSTIPEAARAALAQATLYEQIAAALYQHAMGEPRRLDLGQTAAEPVTLLAPVRVSVHGYVLPAGTSLPSEVQRAPQTVNTATGAMLPAPVELPPLPAGTLTAPADAPVPTILPAGTVLPAGTAMPADALVPSEFSNAVDV